MSTVSDAFSYCNIDSSKSSLIDPNGEILKNQGPSLTDKEAACYSSYMLNQSRQKLDGDLHQIYDPANSVASTYQSNYEYTMLTGVVWAMLGTTVLYYAFTKI
jgi:hypothetical protein